MATDFCYPIERKNLGDYYEMMWRCAKCGFCRNVLPSDIEHERFGRQCPCGDRFKFESYFASGRNELARLTIAGKHKFTERFRHILYTCTTCGLCEEWCSVMQGLYPLRATYAMREYFVKNGGELYDEHKEMLKGLIKNKNRLNRNNSDRLGWIEGQSADQATGQVQKGKGKIDIIYFVGCRSSFQRKEIALNTYNILTKKLGLNVAFIEDERCCGMPLLDIGKEELAVEFMKHNIEKIAAIGSPSVLFSCAECFSSFNNLSRYGLEKEFETVHLSQLLASKIDEGKLKLGGMEGKRVAFHDPCYLGRHEGIYEEPRAILSGIKGVELIELPRNRKNSWCCGGGGGVGEAFNDFAQWTAAERFEEVKMANADTVITSCPGCKNNMWGAASARGVEIYDIAELVNRLT